MKVFFQAGFLCCAVASVAVATTAKLSLRLTPQHLAELTAPGKALHPKAYTVQIDGLQLPKTLPYEPLSDVAPASGPLRVTFGADKPRGVIECVRECRFPSEFQPPRATAGQTPEISPLRPAAFDTVNAGWTIRLAAKPQGNFIAVYGIADYVEGQVVAGGYGSLLAPIYSEKGGLISPNNLTQPRFQTTTTRFCIFATPAEPYEVTLYRGEKSEKHVVTLTLE